jgi:hypothetical protein
VIYINTEPHQANFLALLPGKKKTSARGVPLPGKKKTSVRGVSHAHPLLCF